MTKRWSAVTRAMWTDARFLGLSSPEPNAQTLWLYLLTNPHQISIPGLLPLGVGAIAGRDDRNLRTTRPNLPSQSHNPQPARQSEHDKGLEERFRQPPGDGSERPCNSADSGPLEGVSKTRI